MNYHLMIDDKFINDFITDAEKAAPGNNTYIIDALKENAQHVKSPLAQFAPYHTPAFTAIAQHISSKDKVFIHWASDSAIAFVLSLPADVPVGMFFWGGDVVEIPYSRFKKSIYGPQSLRYFEKYEERDIVEWNFLRPKRIYKTLIKRYIKYPRNERKIARARDLFFRRLNYFFNWNIIDHEWIKAHYTTNVENKYFFYNVNPKPGDENTPVPDKTVTTILLGNSSTPTNNHLEALEALAKFKEENIRLVIPLNYGNKHYGDVVEKKALAIFGKDKVMALRDFMGRDAYYQLLDEVDVAIMYHYRTQAVGNILALIYRGKKMFVHGKSTVYQLLERQQVPVYDAQQIAQMSFEELRAPMADGQAQHAIEKTDKIFDQDKKMQVLREMLS